MTASPRHDSRKKLLSVLREQLHQRVQFDSEVISSGSTALDRLLPECGFRRGTLIEWLSADTGSAATSLAFQVAHQACRQAGVLVLIDRHRRFYPPAAARTGIDLQKMVVVVPANKRDAEWALHQVLSCPAVAAALAWSETLDDRMFRRLQLAAQKGKSLGLLVRPASARASPSWSHARFLVLPLATPNRRERRVRVELIQCQGAQSDGAIELAIDEETGLIHETNPLPLVAELVSRASRRAAGAS